MPKSSVSKYILTFLSLFWTNFQLSISLCATSLKTLNDRTSCTVIYSKYVFLSKTGFKQSSFELLDWIISWITIVSVIRSANNRKKLKMIRRKKGFQIDFEKKLHLTRFLIKQFSTNLALHSIIFFRLFQNKCMKYYSIKTTTLILFSSLYT